MPNLNEVVSQDTEVEVATKEVATDGIVDTTTVEKEPEQKPEKKAKAKTKAKAKKTEEEKQEFIRPPLEQLTRDFESAITTHEIDGHKVVKLGYKCGKILYGIKKSPKDFRLIAFKARKKSKSVNGKSRCIYYFGVDKETAKALTKAHPEISISKFGKCAVQSQTPVELVLDRTTYTEKFDKDADKVIELLSSLAATTVESKSESWQSVKEKTEAKKKSKAKAETEAEAKE